VAWFSTSVTAKVAPAPRERGYHPLSRSSLDCAHHG
jgi:hypothetical protein